MVNKLKIQEQSNLSLIKIIQHENIKFSELKALSNVCLSESLIEAAFNKKKILFSRYPYLFT